MKILSPAGNFESLKMAVFNGADEVYLGINDFNARNIDGFTLETLGEAVDFAHIYDVKVLLAINILFSDEELQSALDVVIEAYNLGVDAFIIQDLALAELISKNYPQIEIHASTQMGIHNLEGVQAIEKFGFKRVVLARETPLEEIKRIKENSNIEIEYFAQGALCVSFSGNCYLSSYLCGASGNRGKCKQLCRLPYTFEKDGKILKKGYLLSAKDFNLIKRLKDLKEAGVDVLKIEGRARRPFYVATATREYYKALHNGIINEENLKLAFNRNYTEGYFNGNGNIISNIQNHIGVFVGKITKVNYGKKFNEVFFSSNRKLFPKSSFKVFFSGEESSVFTAYDLKEISKGQYKTTTTQNFKKGDEVWLIVDAKLEDEILKAKKKIPLEIDIFAKLNENIKAELLLDNKKMEVIGDVCDQAKNQPLTDKDLIDNFNKNEFFDVKLNIRVLDKVFIQKQVLNEFRRKVFQEVVNLKINKYKNNLEKINIKIKKNIKKLDNFQIIEDLNINLTEEKIIYSPEEYSLKNILLFIEKCKNENKKPYLDTPNFALEKDIILLKDIISKTKISIIANNYYALTFDTEIVIGAGLNVYNSLTATIFDKPIITAESNIANKAKFPYMTFRHCPFKNHLNANCSACPYTDGYTYKMDNRKVLTLKRKKLSTCTFYLV